MPNDIFISYSSNDRDKALALTEVLQTLGYSVWIDKTGLEGASNWSKEIAQSLSDCSVLVLLLSNHSLASRNVSKELSAASELKKQILPIALEKIDLRDEFLYHLSGLQRVKFEDTEGIVTALKKIGLNGSHRIGENDPGAKLPSPEIFYRLAVLPFDDLSPLHDNEWFADGMMDELIGTLGSLEQIHVNPRADVIFYKKNKPKLSELAAELKCRYVVDGGVQKSGEKIRIRVSLSDVTEHKQIWSEKYDGTFDDIFDFQEKTAISITEALRLTLTPEEEKKVEHRPTQNPEAYELYLKGEEYYSRSTRTDLEHALGLYEEAFRCDPKFVEAVAMIATTCQSLYRLYSRKQSWLIRAEEALEQVFEIEGRTARYYGISSAIHFVCGRLDLALSDARKAIELDSNYVQGYAALGTACQLLGDKEGAVAAWEKVVSINENDRHAHFGLIIVLSELQQPEYLRTAAQRALPIYERYLKLNPGDDNAQVEYATILESAGKIEESLHLADELALNSALDGFLLYNLCCLYMHRGRQEKAMEMLTRSIRNGHINLEHIRRDPDLEPLRDLPEFQVLMKELSEHSKLKES